MFFAGIEPLISHLGAPLLVAGSLFLIHSMPAGFLALIAAWTLLSVPVGMLVGHCSLNEL